MALQTGWPSRQSGGRAIPRGLTFDPGSVRVQSYSLSLDRVLEELPARFAPYWISKPQAGPYEPHNNPIGTVAWIGSGTWSGFEQRNYVVYFDIVEDAGPRPPRALSAGERDALDALQVPGRGTSFVVATSAANLNRLRVVPLMTGTRVTVYESLGGVLRQHAAPGAQNPFDVTGPSGLYPLSALRAYRVETNRPVLAALECKVDPAQTPPGSTWYPSADGRLRGRDFRLAGPHSRLWVLNSELALDPPSSVRVTDASGVRVLGLDAWTGDLLELDAPQRVEVLQGPSVLVRAPPTANDPLVPAASDSGVWVGSPQIHTLPPQGQLVLGSLDEPAELAGFRHDTGARVLPPGASSYSVGAGPEGVFVTSLGAQVPSTVPARILDANFAQNGPGDDRLFGLSGGAGADLGDTLPSVGGMDYLVPAGLGSGLLVYSVSPDTAVSVLDIATASTRQVLLGADQTLRVDEPDALRIQSSKPVRVEPVQTSGTCARYLSGIDPGADLRVDFAERRGFALRLTATDPVGDPAVQTAGPGQEVTFALRLENLARWTQGRGLSDAASMTVEGLPAGWTAAFPDPLVGLGPDGSANLALRITPAADTQPGDSASFRVVATSQGNPGVQDALNLGVQVTLEHGVDLWFGRNLDFPGPDQAERRTDPGQTTVFDLVIKNVGGASDVFDLRTTPPLGSWGIELRYLARPISRITLGPGEARPLELRVTAPDAGELSILRTSVEAQSTTDESSSARIIATTRLQPQLAVRLDASDPLLLVAPGTTGTFTVTLTNTGPDGFTADLSLHWKPLPGWSNGTFPTSLSLGPHASTQFTLTVRVPATSLATDFVQLRLAALASLAGGTDADAKDDLFLTVQAAAERRFRADAPDALTAGSTESLAFVVATFNDGNAAEDVRITAGQLPSGVRLPNPNGTRLPPRKNATLEVRLTVPSWVPAGVYDASVRASTRSGLSIELPFTLTVPTRAALAVTVSPRAFELAPGEAAELVVQVRNEGNAVDTVALRVRSVPLDLSPLDQEDALAPNATISRHYAFVVPPGLENGTYAVQVVAASGNDADVLAEVDVPAHVGLPDLTIRELTLHAGGLVVVRVGNEGETRAVDVVVELRQGGQAADRVVLKSIPAGEDRLALLRLLGGRLTADAEVAVDPDLRIGEVDRDDNRRHLEPTAGLDEAAPASPGFAAWTLGTVAAALACARRRAP